MNDESISVQAETHSAWDEIYLHFKDLMSTVEDKDDACETIAEATAFMDKLTLRLRGGKPRNSCLQMMVNMCR